MTSTSALIFDDLQFGSIDRKEIAKTISRCEELLIAAIRGKAEKVAELVSLAHEAYTSVLMLASGEQGALKTQD